MLLYKFFYLICWVQNCIIMIKCQHLHLNNNRVILQAVTLPSHRWKRNWSVELQLLWQKRDKFSKWIKYMRSHQYHLSPTSCHWCCGLLWHNSSFTGNPLWRDLDPWAVLCFFMLTLTNINFQPFPYNTVNLIHYGHTGTGVYGHTDKGGCSSLIHFIYTIS